MTSVGGVYDRGVLFAYDTVTHVYQKLKDIFDYDIAYNGIYPYGITAYNGLLYVTTANAGQHQVQRKLVYSKGVNNYSLNMEALPKGIYLLQAADRTIRFMRM